jgi:L-fuculose-phosphate aldolase
MTRKPNGHPLDEVRAAVLGAAKAMHARGLVAGTAGNVSGRVDDGSVVVTPSSLAYDEMALDDLVVVESEKGVHLATLAAHPEVGAVVHCHAIHASMFAVAREPIPAAVDEFVVYIGGEVPVCDYHPAGSDALADAVAAALADRSAALMASHGLVTVGRTVDDALHSALVVEHNAEIVWGARLLGTIAELPEKTRTGLAGVYDFVRHQTWLA